MPIQFELIPLHLPLRYPWRLSRNTSTFKNNFLIRASRGSSVGLGEVAPNIRYGETSELIVEHFHFFQKKHYQIFNPVYWNLELKDLPISQSLKMGLDMAFCRLVANEKGIPVSEVFGLPSPRSRPMAYTIPVMEPEEIGPFLLRENLHRFSWLKVKVNQALALPMTLELLKLTNLPIAIDGNEAWSEVNEVVEFSKQVPKNRVLFLEQPLPATQQDDYLKLAPKSALPIWGDESIISEAEPEFWKQAFHGINVKLMKAGSFQQAISMLTTARSIGLKTMIGCMVETSVGISAALALESLADYLDLDGFLLLENEPFGLLEEKDGNLSPYPGPTTG